MTSLTNEKLEATLTNGKLEATLTNGKLETSSEVKSIKTVEAMLEKLGGFSWFQLWAAVVTISPEISAAMISLSPVLIGSNQFAHSNNETLSASYGASSYPGSLKTVVLEWNLIGDKAWLSDLFTSLQMCGALFGSMMAGQFAERFGRKKAHFGLCFTMGVFGAASGLAPDPYSFCVFRFMTGFSVGGCYVVYLNYLMEFLTPDYRTVCGCVSLWSLGEMLLALFGYLLPGWRQILWVTPVPAIIVLVTYPWMPESPRWLLCHGKTEEATEVFDQIARWNGKPNVNPSDVKVLQKEILLGNGESLERIDSLASLTTTTITTNKKSFCSSLSILFSSFKIFHYREYRFQMVVLMFSWFGSQLIYYGISFNMKNLTGDPYLNVLYMGIVGFPGSFIGLLFNNRLGRRTTIIGFATVSFCLLMTLIAIDETNLSQKHPNLILFLCLSVRLFVAAGFAVLSCFTAESFPTIVRVGCMGICALFGNIGGILAPQFVYISTIVKSAQYITFGLLSLATIFGAFNLREMTGKPLDDFLKKNEKEPSFDSIATIDINV